jgi:hypothetical protein
MLKQNYIKILALIFTLNSFAFGQQPQSESKSVISAIKDSKVQTVEYCELMKNPEMYIGKFIRLEAIFNKLISLESILYVECNPKLSAVSVEIAEEKLDTFSNEILSKADTLDNKKVTVVGRILGPRKPNSKFNYGHYGWSKYLFEIYAFENIESISTK